MSGDSKDFKGDSDDLLSQLLDLEDVVSQPGGDAPTPPNDQTEVLSKNPEVQNDQTEVLVKEEDEASLSLDDLMKDETDAVGPESVEFFSEQLQGNTPEASNDQSFQDELEQTILEQAKPVDQNPFDSEKREKTIVLDAPLEEPAAEAEEIPSFDSTEFLDKEDAPMLTQAESEPQADSDPIEDALAEFSEEQGDDLSAAAISSVRENKPAVAQDELEVEDLFSAPEAQPKSDKELSAEDFADVFQSGPIQVPQQKSAFGGSASKFASSKKWIGLAAGILLPVGLLSFSAYSLWSEEGLFGVRVEGFGLAKVYRAPSDEVLAEFVKQIESARMARLSDRPEEIEKSITDLEGILALDERNLGAAYELLESSALMIVWKGIQTEYPAKYETAANFVSAIEARLEEVPPTTRLARAKALRSIEVGEMPAALNELELVVAKVGGPQADDHAILGELYHRRGDSERAIEHLSAATQEHIRAQFYLSLAKEDRPSLEQLAKSNYLPAKVQLESGSDTKSLRENVSSFEALLEKVNTYPWLAALVQGKLGDIYQAAGDGASAREQWKAIVSKSPENFHTWKKLAASYRQDSEWEESLNAYRAAIKAGGLQKGIALDFVRLLRTRLKVVEALDVIEQAIQKYPNAPEFLYEKGETQLAIYQEEPAKQSFQKALELNAAFEPAILSLARLAVRQQDYTAAQALYAKIPESSQNYSMALMGLGGLALRQRDFNEAKKFYGLSIKTDAKNVEAYDSLVQLLLREEDDKRAAFLAGQGVEQLPKSPLAHLAMARVLNFQRQYEDAISQLDPFIQTHNHLMPLVFEYIDIQINKGDYEEARRSLEELSAKEVSEPEILFLKAKLNYGDENTEASPVLGSREAAWRYIQGAVSAHTDNEKYLALQARIAFALDERMQAFEVADRLLSFYPRNPVAFEVKADVHAYNGNYDEAIRSYQRASSLTRFKGEIYRKMAGTYRSRGDTAKAIQYYQRLVEWYPSDASAHLELGKLYNDQAQFSRAARSFQRAAQLRPSMPEPFYYLGFIQKETGDYVNAVKSFERYLSLEPQGVESATIKDEIYFMKNASTSN